MGVLSLHTPFLNLREILSPLFLGGKDGQSVAMVQKQLSLVTWVPCYTHTTSTQLAGVLLHLRNVIVYHGPCVLLFLSEGKKVKESGERSNLWREGGLCLFGVMWLRRWKRR